MDGDLFRRVSLSVFNARAFKFGGDSSKRKISGSAPITLNEPYRNKKVVGVVVYKAGEFNSNTNNGICGLQSQRIQFESICSASLKKVNHNFFTDKKEKIL